LKSFVKGWLPTFGNAEDERPSIEPAVPHSATSSARAAKKLFDTRERQQRTLLRLPFDAAVG